MILSSQKQVYSNYNQRPSSSIQVGTPRRKQSEKQSNGSTHVAGYKGEEMVENGASILSNPREKKREDVDQSRQEAKRIRRE